MDINKKIIIISINRDKNGLFQSSITPAVEKVVLTLEAKGMLCEVFHMEYLSSVEHMAAYLILRGDAQFFLFINEDNRDFVNALAEQIRFLQPESHIEFEVDNTGISEKKERSYSMTFAQGYYMSLVGNYPLAVMDGTIKHIKIKGDFSQKNLLLRVNELCNANSSVCIESSEAVYLNQKQKDYEETKRYLANNRILPINYVYSDSDFLFINGECVNSLKRIVKIPYHQWKDYSASIAEELVFTLETEDDLKMFREDLEFYYKTNTVSQSPFLVGQMHMICRFLSEQDCTVRKLPQVTIKENGKVYPCNQDNWEIGSIGESSLQELKKNCAVIDETEKVAKQCNSCKCRGTCSMCSFMSDFLVKHYCDLRRNYPYISELYYETNVVKDLKRKFKIFDQTPLSEIKISNSYFQSITDVHYTGKKVDRVLFYPHVCIIYSQDIYTIWSPFTGKIFRISKEYAVIAEFIFCKIPQKEFQYLLMEMFEYGRDDSSFVVNSSMNLFKESGLLML